MGKHRVKDIELHIIQCKSSVNKLPQEAINKLIIATSELFDLKKNLRSEVMQKSYSPFITDTVANFIYLHRNSESDAEINIHFYIAHLKSSNTDYLKNKEPLLHEAVSNRLYGAKSSFKILGAKELLDLYRRPQKQDYSLDYIKDVLSADEKGFTCLVNLGKFYEFISDPRTGKIRENLFESNVRDYQGLNQVNKDIDATLKKQDSSIVADFWWLNNGVTIVCEKVSRKDGLSLTNPEIVNGLQTSYAIYDYFNGKSQSEDDRNIIVRIIEVKESDDKLRDKIIRATNNQTAIAPLILHSTEPIHYDIEAYLKNQTPPIFYERRHGRYRNENSNSFIDMQLLAQAVVAILIQKPGDARSRIRAFLKPKKNYDQVFNNNYPLKLYFICAYIRKEVENFIDSSVSLSDIQARSRARYVIHHIMMDMTMLLTNSEKGPNINKENGLEIYANLISEIDMSSITQQIMEDSSKRVLSVFEGNKYKASPNSAKTKEMAEEILTITRAKIKILKRTK